MHQYSFFLYRADTSTRTYPMHENVDAETREAALKAFCRKYRLTVDSDDNGVVWFLGQDGEALQYSCTER